jgi:hypothetical protein
VDLRYLLNGAAEGRALPTGNNNYNFSNFNVAQGLGSTGLGGFGLGGFPGANNPIAPAPTPAVNTARIGSYDFGGNVGGFDVSSLGSMPGSGPAAPVGGSGEHGSAWGYTDANGNQQVATFDPQKSQNAYLDGQVTQANESNHILDAMNAALTPAGQSPLRAGQFVSSTGNPYIQQAASDYNIETLRLNQEALVQKPAAIMAPTVNTAPPRIAQGAFSPAPFSGRW